MSARPSGASTRAAILMTLSSEFTMSTAPVGHHTDPATPTGHGRQPVEDIGPNAVCAPAARRSAGPQDTVDTLPLYASDPVRVDGYQLVARLGEGGTADVFYAVTSAGGPVALKLLRARGGGQIACMREFGMAFAMDADCTAPVLGHGLSPAGAYLVTTYLAGFRCGTTLKGRSLPVGQLWAFGSALARVLARVHAKGVVHCDVKPSNLLVRDHDVRLIDFGIARYVDERYGVDGTVECTRGWAAPEQVCAARATPAVDVFAWGCLLAYLAGGVHPFASQSDQEWILRLQSAEPDLSRVHSGLATVIRRALARDPRDRPSASELATICQVARGRTPVAGAGPRYTAAA
jgi:serine/threonine protein kinase